MALQQQQEEFRQYLDDVGILKIIYQGLKAVYAQNPEERPKDALQFFMGQMNLDVTENPRAAEIDDLKRQVQDLQRKYEELQAKYDAVKASSSPSKTPTTPEAKSEEADAPANSDGS